MQVTDPQALKALAHPLRLDLLEMLGSLGPATAAQCARQLGTTQASCSFHLRQLLKYGFVEQAPDSGDRRERPWQLTDIRQSWSAAETGAAGAAVERSFIEREARRLQRWADLQLDEPDEWRRATFVGGSTLPMTAEELRAAGEAMAAVLSPYLERLGHRESWPDGARLVRIFMGSAPAAHLDNPSGTHAEVQGPNQPETPQGEQS